MHLRVWHGTNQDFKRFDAEMLGLTTSNSASTQAFFFAKSPETAWDYAESAARKLVPHQAAHEARVADLLAQANKAMARRDLRAYEKHITEAEDLEATAMQAPPSGATLMLCELTLDNPLTVSGQDTNILLNLGGVLQEARDGGHDGVILLDIADTPSGNMIPDDHFAVFNPKRVRFIDRAMNLEEAGRLLDRHLPEPDCDI